MSTLMKYEFRKTLAIKLILLGIVAAAQLVFLAGLLFHKENLTILSVFLLTLLAFGSILLIGLGSVITLHRDMNTKQGYMLFMTPNSCYKILGAKVLENGLSLLIGGTFFFSLGLLDITLLLAHYGSLQEFWTLVTDFIHSLNENIRIDAAGLACFTFSLLASWFSTICAAYLADVISAALLNGKKFNGLLSFVFFLLIAILVSWLQQTLGANPVINVAFLVQGAIALVLSAGMYVLTAQIMERKLSV